MDKTILANAVTKSDLHKACVAVASMSPCKKRKVGAIIAKQSSLALPNEEVYDIVAYGYNFDIDGGSCECSDGKTKDTVIHAEQACVNDFIHREASLESYSLKMYVTHQPCAGCLAAIDKLGIAYEVVGEFLKFDSHKPRMQLVPASLSVSCARALTHGAKKYKVNNWRKTDNTERYISALQRHIDAWREGEEIDPDSGLSHLDHMAANLAFLIELKDLPRIQE